MSGDMKFREFVYMYEEKIIIKSDHLGVNRLEQIYSIIGDMNMMDIIPMYIMEVVSLIQNSMAPGTADKYFRFLKRAFDFAQKEGYISENPMKHIELPQYKREVRNTKILESQRKCLMVLIEASKQKTFLQMMSIIGLPFNVARALFWDDIDFVGDILNVRYAVKDRVTDINARYLMDSDKQRKIHIPPFIMKGLMEIYEKQTASIRNKNEVTSLHRPIFQSSDGRLYGRGNEILIMETFSTMIFLGI